MELNSLIKNNKKKIRVGRGIGSGKGKTSSRGHKGQKSRSGVAIKSFEGGQMPLYRRLPKRGFKSFNKNNTAILNLSKIQNIIDKSKNDIKNILDLKILKEKNLLNKKYLKLKILGTGELKKNIEISAHYISKKALTKVEKAGGKINIIKK
ncbi:50S ribosomal protein L15 [Candidatus Pelagibacter bacterium]|jgi:large subunit ribosomal protein L15|nr:50S ribosomal protein L15 [Candidatus Pelagibacter bacterium]